MPSVSSISSVAAKSRLNHVPTRLLMNVGVAVGGVVLSRLLAAVTQVLLARLMGVADFGRYTTVFSLLGPVTIITSLGLDTWLLRQGGTTSILTTAIRQVFAIRLIVTSVLMTLVVAVLAIGRFTELTPTIIMLAAVALLFELMLITTYTALRAQIRNVSATIIQIVVASVMLLLLFISADRTMLVLVTAYRVLSSLIGLVLAGWFLRRTLRSSWRVPQPLQIIKQARVFFLSDLLAGISLKSDLTLIALLAGSLAAGIYSPALTIVNTTFIVPHVVWQVLLPTIARQDWNTRRFRWMIGLTLAGSLAYGLFWAVALLNGAEWIMRHVYGQEYLAAAPLLQIMCLIPLLKSINFCWATLMIARDRQVLRVKLQAVGAITNAALNLACIPVFGLIGAATVNAVTELVLLGCYSYGFWRTLA